MPNPQWSEAAAIDWIVRAVHNKAMVRYMTNAEDYDKIFQILQGAMAGLSVDADFGPLGGGGCPRGWCEEDDACMPCEE